MKSQSKRFPKARASRIDEDPQQQQQKALSKKEASLKFYEPPAQFRHFLTLRSKQVMPTNKEERPTAATGNMPSHQPFVRSSTASTAPPGSSDRTLPESASSMSDDDDKRESSSSSTNTATSVDEEVSTTTSEEHASSSSKKERSIARLLKKSLRHLEDIIQSTLSKHKETNKSSTKNKSNKKNKKNRLPETGFFSNNHIMVNRERALVGDLKPLHRSRYLDSLALFHAVDLADAGEVEHLVERPLDLRRLLQSNEVGENVQRGSSIRDMHTSAMKSDENDDTCSSSRKRNILRSAYTEFGMATAVSRADGKLYMVQLFRGPTLQENKKQEPESQQVESSSEAATQAPKEEEEEPKEIAPQ